MLLVFLLVASGLGATAFGPPVLTDGSHPSVRLYPEQIDALRRLSAAPPVSAAASLLVDVDSGQTLQAKDEHRPLPPASTAKLMTALLVLQKGHLADTVTVSARAAGTEGSRMGLQTGEKLTVRDLLYGLLIPSGNDAAVALAEYVSGDEDRFVTLMNEAAAGMKLRETHFTNPHGLDDPQQTISAADLLALARAALAYPEIATIVGTRQIEVAGHPLTNTNELLGVYRGADGVKTGTTDEAGECLVASVTRGGHRLLLVILHSQERYADARALLDYAAAGWQWKPLTLPDNALAWQIGPDGHYYRLRTASSVDVFLPAWQWPMASLVRLIDSGRPITGTHPIGTLRLDLNGQTLASAPLVVWPAQ